MERDKVDEAHINLFNITERKTENVEKVDNNVEGSADDKYSMFTQEAEWQHWEF